MIDSKPAAAGAGADAGAFFDRYAADWEAFYSDAREERRAFDYLNRQRQLLRLVDRHVPAESRILEFGCGTGHTAARLAERGHRLTCLDVSPEMIEATRRTLDRAGHAVPLYVGHLGDLVEESAGPFDAIVGMGVMEYIDDHDAAFDEIHRLLSPGGVCLLSFPNAASPLRRLERALKRAAALPMALATGDERYRDIAWRPSRLHAPRAVLRHLEQAGFAVEACRFLSYGFRIGRFWIPPLRLVRQLDEALAASPLRWIGRNYIVVVRREG